MLKYNPSLKTIARRLRSGMTDAERRLWERLRGKQVQGVQFYRQRVIGEYIVDFYAPTVRLVVEVDGSQHFDEERRRADERRDVFLAGQGLSVLRFNNLEVLRGTDSVVEVIHRRVGEVLAMENPPSVPPFSKGGRKEAGDPKTDTQSLSSDTSRTVKSPPSKKSRYVQSSPSKKAPTSPFPPLKKGG